MTAAVKTQRHLPKAHHDVYQQAIAGMSPKSSAGVTSLTVLPNGSAVRVKEDALVVVLFLHCLSHTPSQDHSAALIAAQGRMPDRPRPPR